MPHYVSSQNFGWVEIGFYLIPKERGKGYGTEAIYELNVEHVEKALLEVLNKVEGVLKAPEPYVWITRFGNFAVEYTLYVFIAQIKRLPEIDANLKRTVLETCKDHKIDISTPRLIQRVENSNNKVD